MRFETGVGFGFSASTNGHIHSYGDYVDELRTTIQKDYALARGQLPSAAVRNNIVYDAMSLNIYIVGDRSSLLNETKYLGTAQNLQSK